MITPNQETLLWPDHHAIQPLTVAPPPGSENPWPGESLLWPSHATTPYTSITPPADWERDIGGIQIVSEGQMQKQQAATPRTLDDEEMPPPSVKGPKEMEDDRKARLNAARARFDQSQPSSARGSNEPLLPVAESPSRSRPTSRTPSTAQSRASSVSAHTPRSHASSEAPSVAPSLAPTINYETLWTSTQSDVVLSYLSIMVDQVPPSFGRVTDETLLLSSSSLSGDVESSLAAKATNSSTLKSKRGRLEASTQQLRDHSEALPRQRSLKSSLGWTTMCMSLLTYGRKESRTMSPDGGCSQ
eukprot:6490593-Amphidinium_carterae.1